MELSTISSVSNATLNRFFSLHYLLPSKCFKSKQQVKILFNQINKIRYYILGALEPQTKPNLLNAHFVTGFTDAEGSFIIRIRANSRSKVG
jgi:hypothetical protein